MLIRDLESGDILATEQGNILVSSVTVLNHFLNTSGVSVNKHHETIRLRLINLDYPDECPKTVDFLLAGSGLVQMHIMRNARVLRAGKTIAAFDSVGALIVGWRWKLLQHQEQLA